LIALEPLPVTVPPIIHVTTLCTQIVPLTQPCTGLPGNKGVASDVRPHTNKIKDASIRSFFDRYFSLGETVFSMICGYAVSSEYFKRTIE
jgi:hypothetical protein